LIGWKLEAEAGQFVRALGQQLNLDVECRAEVCSALLHFNIAHVQGGCGVWEGGGANVVWQSVSALLREISPLQHGVLGGCLVVNKECWVVYLRQ
jgi:hypothetical protein